MLQVLMRSFSIILMALLALEGCLSTGIKHINSDTNLASIEIDELPISGYVSYKVGLTALDTTSQTVPAASYTKGAGKYTVTVTPGHYKILLDYFDGNNQKVYSADFCTPLVANNDVHLTPGLNPLTIKVCTENAQVLDANVSITPVLYSGNGQSASPATPTTSVHPTDGGGGVLQQVMYQAMATHFDGLGSPYGGCGVPQDIVETNNFVALNVQNTANDYSKLLQRPIAPGDNVGAFNNGLNCGRWIQVTMGNFCQDGVNSGQPGTDFCAGGQWVSNQFTGSTVNMIVSDSCQDNNRWCRDDSYHIDVATSALTQFGPGIDSSAWGNPQVSWMFIDAPNYSGDIQIGFAQHAEANWPAIIINHLQRGIHKVEQNVGGVWLQQKMNSDMGQSYILTPDSSGLFKIRIYDASDQLVGGGKVYVFGMPTSCGSICSAVYTGVGYTTQ